MEKKKNNNSQSTASQVQGMKQALVLLLWLTVRRLKQEDF